MPAQKKIKTKNNFIKNYMRKKKIKTLFFLGHKWKNYLKKINIYQKDNCSTFSQEKNKMLFLNARLKSELSPFFFRPWIKDKKIFLTKRQSALKKLYAKYKKKYSLKKRKDFLKTSFGEILKTTHLNSEIKRGLWLSARVLLRHKRIRKLNNKKILFKKNSLSSGKTL